MFTLHGSANARTIQTPGSEEGPGKDIQKPSSRMGYSLQGTTAPVGSSAAGKALDVQRYALLTSCGDHDLVRSWRSRQLPQRMLSRDEHDAHCSK